jgi:DNA-binding SARP family transcriptional activator
VVARRPQTGRTARGTVRIVLVRILGPSPGSHADDGAGLRPMERKLVAALAVCRPGSVSVDSLASALWTSHPPTSARKTIQTNVLRVRTKLGRTAIETIGNGYRLGAGVETDIERFERAVREAAETTSCRTARWDAALAWCSSAPLEELRHWAPADSRRAQFEELRQSAIEARWEAALDEQSPEDVVADLEALVAAEPLREQRWSLLLVAYERAGRRVDGLRAFERARRTLALELGVSPGAELVEKYESLLREEGAPSDAPTSRFDHVTLSDRRATEAEAARARGDAATAARLFVDAARCARDAGDVRRFAEAALGAAGDGWRASLDATDEIVLLLTEALEQVPAGPTRLRARLLARSAIAQSHHRSAAECEATATKALAIARAIEEPSVIACALHALCVVVWDPGRHEQHWKWADELLALADVRPDEPWDRWALPIVARLRAIDGNIVGACEALDQLSDEASRCGDRGGLFDASYAGVLRATVAGDWSNARACAGATRAAADAALIDPAGGALLQMGMLGIIDLLAGPTDVEPLGPIEWPMPSMELSVKAWYADCLARTGQVETACEALAAIDPSFVADVAHDAYWLATLSMLADAAHLTRHEQTGTAVWECLRPVIDLTIFDPGLLYRGSAAHAAGLAAAACGRDRDAIDLLTVGLAQHEAHGSPWMIVRSRHALAALTVD